MNYSDTLKKYYTAAARYGLHRSGSGLLLGDVPFRCVGVNAYDLVATSYPGLAPDKSLRTLEYLAARKVPVLRFSLFGHSYRDYEPYFKNKAGFLNLLKRICERADELQIGLIPSFFWLFHGLPDYLDEELSAWGRKDSKTFTCAMDITKEIVTLLQGYKCVWAWEFGNEYNLQCDLNQLRFLPPLPPHTTREKRDESDFFTADILRFVLSKWADAVRECDTHGRLIGDGNGIYRPAQYHRHTEESWTVDTVAEKSRITEYFHPDGVDMISEHLYHVYDDTEEYDVTVSGTRLSLTYRSHLRLMNGIANNLDRVYYVGEFGHDAFTVFTDGDKMKVYENMLRISAEEKVPLMLIWNFSYTAGNTEYSFGADSDITEGIFALILSENEKLFQ